MIIPQKFVFLIKFCNALLRYCKDSTDFKDIALYGFSNIFRIYLSLNKFGHKKHRHLYYRFNYY